MKYRSVELRVKIKSLIAEAGIIRLEERRQLQSVRRHNEAIIAKEGGAAIVATAEELRSKIAECHFNYVSLHSHRVMVVRSESRYAQLARCYLQGRPYASVEKIDWSKAVVWGEALKFRNLVQGVAKNVTKFIITGEPRLADVYNELVRQWMLVKEVKSESSACESTT